MSYFGMSKRMYADRRAPDGVIATGWRTVRKGGRVKFASCWYEADELKEIVGEYVWVDANDYWLQEVLIHRGRIGCLVFLCKAVPVKA